MLAWNRVTRRGVVRAIHEYDQLGPEEFFSEHGLVDRRMVAPVIQQDVPEESDLDSPLALGQLFDIRLTNLDDPGPHH